MEGEVLRSKFSSAETFVEASLNTTDTRTPSLSIKSGIKEHSSILSRKLDKVYKVVRDMEMLSVLVPDISITRKSESNMSSWLRATRFLESDSLNLLIDSNAESHNTRKLMFSSLFGIRESLEKQQHLDAIKRSLGAENTLKKEIQKAEQNAEKNKKEAELLQNELSLPHFELANGYLTRISELLNISNLRFEVSY